MKKIIWETQILKPNNKNSLSYADVEQEAQGQDLEGWDEGDIENYPDLPVEKVVQTPFGIFSISDDLNPYKTYKFYLADTNFNVTQSVKDIIEETEGVEILKVLSRYRFIIAVGRCFDAGEVRMNITSQLCAESDKESLTLANGIYDKLAEIQDIELRDKAHSIIEVLNIDYDKEWIFYMFPNGAIEFSGIAKDSDNEELLLYNEEKMKILECHEISSGVLIQYDSDQTTD